MTSTQHRRLTRSVKRFLDGVWYLVLFLAILFPLIMLVGAGSESKDVRIQSSFRVFADASPQFAPDTVTLADSVVRGRGEVRIDTDSTFAWYLSNGVQMVAVILFLYGLAQLRALFRALADGRPFSVENAARVRKLGIIVVVWYVVVPLLQALSGFLILNDIDLEVRGAIFTPATGFSIAGIVTGLAIVVLSGVLREAAEVHEDQSLTI
jgi:hypothetical protein